MTARSAVASVYADGLPRETAMRPILTLRQYSHDLIVHSHDHAQLVFGLSGLLDFEVEGCGSQVVQPSFVVIPAGAHPACGCPRGSRCLVLDVPSADRKNARGAGR